MTAGTNCCAPVSFWKQFIFWSNPLRPAWSKLPGAGQEARGTEAAWGTLEARRLWQQGRDGVAGVAGWTEARGLLQEQWKVWQVLLGWIHGVLARDRPHCLLGDQELLSWHHGDVVMRLQGEIVGSLLGHHRNDLVVQPTTHGLVTTGRVWGSYHVLVPLQRGKYFRAEVNTTGVPRMRW